MDYLIEYIGQTLTEENKRIKFGDSTLGQIHWKINQTYSITFGHKCRHKNSDINSLFINITKITINASKKTSQINFSVIQKFLKIKCCFVLYWVFPLSTFDFCFVFFVKKKKKRSCYLDKANPIPKVTDMCHCLQLWFCFVSWKESAQVITMFTQKVNKNRRSSI